MAQINCVQSGKKTHRKERPTMAIRLVFSIEHIFYKIIKSFIGIPIQIVIFLSAFPHTGLGAPVLRKQ